MATKLTIEGKEYEFKGEYRTKVAPSEYYMSDTGVLLAGPADWGSACIGPRAILHPIPVRHTFGKVVFEETGQPRKLKAGEWGYTPDGWQVFCDREPLHGSYIPLRPVEILP